MAINEWKKENGSSLCPEPNTNENTNHDDNDNDNNNNKNNARKFGETLWTEMILCVRCM